ncbi:hypothetical protein TREMEDRAFT_66354 [Tremella mesenterica DSM 1558]|uniref:uncharacterized protein n=1 Tax=Tremella mesenterica (strain ATCC 24925 / CBS 8224 / DSM 1558 / NBRC 9311 / NRRL Y-6157 / RJB 2259-6 / UBC 559-6) TaxID=578456 RepID=UPI00032D0A52|nr:uncharacterized protein TREMEDRAFT_66354 [Tremella mesenterica DSM 1558]EIW65631.1 hypothetical protein TREMEDRAFT_66354 [Tremella mesenterica DSM 1558]
MSYPYPHSSGVNRVRSNQGKLYYVTATTRNSTEHLSIMPFTVYPSVAVASVYPPRNTEFTLCQDRTFHNANNPTTPSLVSTSTSYRDPSLQVPAWLNIVAGKMPDTVVNGTFHPGPIIYGGDVAKFLYAQASLSILTQVESWGKQRIEELSRGIIEHHLDLTLLRLQVHDGIDTALGAIFKESPGSHGSLWGTTASGHACWQFETASTNVLRRREFNTQGHVTDAFFEVVCSLNWTTPLELGSINDIIRDTPSHNAVHEISPQYPAVPGTALFPRLHTPSNGGRRRSTGSSRANPQTAVAPDEGLRGRARSNSGPDSSRSRQSSAYRTRPSELPVFEYHSPYNGFQRFMVTTRTEDPWVVRYGNSRSNPLSSIIVRGGTKPFPGHSMSYDFNGEVLLKVVTQLFVASIEAQRKHHLSFTRPEDSNRIQRLNSVYRTDRDMIKWIDTNASVMLTFFFTNMKPMHPWSQTDKYGIMDWEIRKASCFLEVKEINEYRQPIVPQYSLHLRLNDRSIIITR